MLVSFWFPKGLPCSRQADRTFAQTSDLPLHCLTAFVADAVGPEGDLGRGSLLNPLQTASRTTARSANTVEDFRQVFEARVLSLSRTHDLLVENAWRAAPIRNILCSELGPYDDGAGTRVLLAGPAVELPAELAVPIGMAIHELTTNAAKYGAFSTPRGWLEVEWDVRGHEGTRKLQLWWTERDGPPVEKPSRKGFGSSLIQRLLTTQCRAEIEFAYDRPGLRFQMSVPLVRSARDEIMTLRPGEASSPGRHS